MIDLHILLHNHCYFPFLTVFTFYCFVYIILTKVNGIFFPMWDENEK